ncbi:MAG: ATP-dependent metallopeptidase FtsH/Yme1/Tma family protein, partial [Clostridium sp.]
MENNNNQNKNGKNPKGGQNITVFIITMLFTLLCVSAMHSLFQQSRTKVVPYSEFNQMLKDGDVESVVISNSKIQITPKSNSKKYPGSQNKYGGLIGVEYYTIPLYDPDLQIKLDKAGVSTYEAAQTDASAS